MSIHISAKNGEIAKKVLLPGDPLRAKYIVEHFVDGARLVSQTRNIYFYTGSYKGKEISVGASGMGLASIGIYSYELFAQYDVDTIVRIGTCGAYTTDLELMEIINVEKAASESTFAKYAWENDEETIAPPGSAFRRINETAQRLQMPLHLCNIHSSDIFYRKNPAVPAIAQKHNCVAVEMEAFALFANAAYCGKSAATLLTVSDIIPTHRFISAEDREKALVPMIELALESI